MVKSEVMVMEKGGGRMNNGERWVLNVEAVRVMKTYRYLGINLTPSLR